MMRAIAAYILRGGLRATSVAVIAAVFSMAVMPLIHISGASVGLVTLRDGVLNGLKISLGAVLVIWALGLLSSLQAVPMQLFIAVVFVGVWLPAVLCAAVLRNRRDLGTALMAAGAYSFAMLLMMYLALGDVTGWWREVLSTAFQMTLANSPSAMNAADVTRAVDSLAEMMGGLLAMGMVISIMINLCLARWWQAAIYNPGGFRQEFIQLRLDRRLALVALFVLVLGSIVSGSVNGLGRDIMFLIMAMFSLQGLALAHAIATAKNANTLWIIMLYVLLMIMTLPVVMVLAAMGLTDSWMDFRKRFGFDGSSEGPSSGSDS